MHYTTLPSYFTLPINVEDREPLSTANYYSSENSGVLEMLVDLVWTMFGTPQNGLKWG